jgi:hypothetical protein
MDLLRPIWREAVQDKAGVLEQGLNHLVTQGCLLKYRS